MLKWIKDPSQGENEDLFDCLPLVRWSEMPWTVEGYSLIPTFINPHSGFEGEPNVIPNPEEDFLRFQDLDYGLKSTLKTIAVAPLRPENGQSIPGP